MEINEFIKNFAAQFDETDVSEFAPETKFKELDEWSSLTALSIIAMVDDELDISIGAKEILASNTIEDLFNTIINK